MARAACTASSTPRQRESRAILRRLRRRRSRRSLETVLPTSTVVSAIAIAFDMGPGVHECDVAQLSHRRQLSVG